MRARGWGGEGSGRAKGSGRRTSLLLERHPKLVERGEQLLRLALGQLVVAQQQQRAAAVLVREAGLDAEGDDLLVELVRVVARPLGEGAAAADPVRRARRALARAARPLLRPRLLAAAAHLVPVLALVRALPHARALPRGDFVHDVGAQRHAPHVGAQRHDADAQLLERRDPRVQEGRRRLRHARRHARQQRVVAPPVLLLERAAELLRDAGRGRGGAERLTQLRGGRGRRGERAGRAAEERASRARQHPRRRSPTHARATQRSLEKFWRARQPRPPCRCLR